MKKRVFTLLLAAALMSSLGMTAFAEPDVTVEPAPQETTTETTTPADPAVVPESQPAPETETAPAPDPVQGQVTEAPAEDQVPAGDGQPAEGAAPGAEDVPEQDAAPAPTDAPAAIDNAETAPAVAPKPEDTTDNYAYGVWLHVVNSSFKGSFANPDRPAKDITNASSVWVEFQKEEDGAYTRKLPTVLPEVTAVNGTFNGWYTRAAVEDLVPSDDGTYCYRKTVQINGQQIVPGETEVPADIQVLYAVIDYQQPAEDAAHLIQYYFDYNGMKDMYGHCLTSTGVKGVSKFTPANAAIYGFNYKSAQGDPGTWEDLKAYWDSGVTFDGYTFKGWSLSPTDGELIAADVEIENDMTFYAVWEKGEDSNETYVPTPDADAGPLTHIRISSGLRDSRHATAGQQMVVSVSCTPIKAVPVDITYTLVFSPNSTGAIQDVLKDPAVRTVTASQPLNEGNAEGFGFKAETDGRNLYVTNLDGQAHCVRVSVAADSINGDHITADGGTAVLSFDHDVSGGWHTTQEPTCTVYGQEEAVCESCKATVTRKIYPLSHAFDFRVIDEPTCTEEGLYGKACMRPGCDATYADYMAELGYTGGSYKDEAIPATGHTYEAIQEVRVEDGAPVYAVSCIHGDDECAEAKCGDANGDGRVNVLDVTKLYKYATKQISKGYIEEICDANGDGIVNTLDITRLYKFAMNQVGTIGRREG